MSHTHKQMVIYEIHDEVEILLSDDSESPIFGALAEVLENSKDNEKKLPVKLNYWLPDQSIVTVLCKKLFFMVQIKEIPAEEPATEIQNEIPDS